MRMEAGDTRKGGPKAKSQQKHPAANGQQGEPRRPPGHGNARSRSKANDRGRNSRHGVTTSTTSDVEGDNKTKGRALRSQRRRNGRRAQGKATSTDRSSQPQVRKRAPQKPALSRTDIYIGRNSPFTAQLARVRSLFDAGESTVTLHGLGAAINRCINIALQVVATPSHNVIPRVETDTVPLLEDMPSTDPEVGPRASRRNISAVHVTLSRM